MPSPSASRNTPDSDLRTYFVKGLSATPVPIAQPPNFAGTWGMLSPSARWQILAARRMQELFPDSTTSEFQKYYELLRASPAPYQEEIFIGIDPRSGRPMFVPRRVFPHHAYVLGGSGAGKTSYGLAQMLIQLADPYVDQRNRVHEPPPILIMDLKQNGDRYLRALAEMLAAARGQKLRFFSNDERYKSVMFDPFAAIRGIEYPLKRVEFLLETLSLIYPEGYGPDFFTNEQRIVLDQIMYEERPRTLAELVRYIREETRRAGGNTDARGLYGALQPLVRALNVQSEAIPSETTDYLDFDRFYEQGEVIYVHLNARDLRLTSRALGKLILLGLVHTAADRRADGIDKQCYVVIDEFHRLAARNVVSLMDDVRDLKIALILAHQSPSSLRTHDGELFDAIFENTAFKQALTVESPRVVELFRMFAHREIEIRRGGSVTFGVGESEGTSQGFGTSYSVSEGPQGTTYSTTSSPSIGFSSSKEKSQSVTSSWHEEMTGGLHPEQLAEVTDESLLSLVLVRGAGKKCLTPTGGFVTPVQGLYPFPEETATAMEKSRWPKARVRTEEEYYRSARPRVDGQTVAEILAPSSRRQRPRIAERPQRTPEQARELRVLKKALEKLGRRLREHMLPECPRILQVARRHGIAVEALLAAAQQLGFDVNDQNDRLMPRQLTAVLQVIQSARHP